MTSGWPAAIAILVTIAGKIAFPLLILRWPFAAGWANFWLDSFDGDILVPLGLRNADYQPIDKLTDWLTYVVIVVMAYRRDWPIRRLLLGLFVFRSIGQAAFLATGEELWLAAFPNFLEPTFLVAATLLAYQRVVRRAPDWFERGFAVLARHRWAFGIGIVVYKLIDEYLTHVGNIDRSELLQRLIEGLGR